MKIKLISILSLLLLCGCAPKMNGRYIVYSCEMDESLRSKYIIKCSTVGDDETATPPHFTFVSDQPLTVGSKYYFRMEEAK